MPPDAVHRNAWEALAVVLPPTTCPASLMSLAPEKANPGEDLAQGSRG